MQIYLASDHAGFFLKEKVKQYLSEKGYLVQDFGANNFSEDDNYPDFIYPCIKSFLRETNGDIQRGVSIIFGGSGTGEAILANRFRGARTVVYNGNDTEIVRIGRMHNNVNVLSVGARFVNEQQVLEAVKIFMSTPFEGGRHAKRVLALDMLQ